MFGLIGHSTSFEDAKRKASMLGFDHIADGDLDVWCTAPPQLVENVEVKSATGISIEGSYIDSCFVPEMLSRFKTARRKVCLLYTSPSPRDATLSRMPSSA